MNHFLRLDTFQLYRRFNFFFCLSVLFKISICTQQKPHLDYVSKVPFKRPDNLFLVERQEAKVLCKEFELDFYLQLEKFSIIKTELEIFIESATNICHDNSFKSICETKHKKILSLGDSLEKTSQLVNSLILTNQGLPRQFRNTQADRQASGFLNIDPEYGYFKLKTQLKVTTTFINSLSSKNNNDTLIKSESILEKSMSYIVTSLEKHLILYRDILSIMNNNDHKALLSLTSKETFQNKLSQLEKTANNISCEFPKINNRSDLARLLEISKIEPYLIEDYFLVYLRTPTVYQNDFKLMQVVPLPFVYANHTYIIESSFPYYLITSTRRADTTAYYGLNDDEWKNCQNTRFGLLCKPERIMKVTIQPFRKYKEILPQLETCVAKTPYEIFTLKQCKTLSISIEDRLIQLNDHTLYAFVTKPIIIPLLCSSRDTTIVIKKPQIVAYHHSCIIRGNIIKESNHVFLNEIEEAIKKKNSSSTNNQIIHTERNEFYLGTHSSEKDHLFQSYLIQSIMGLLFIILILITWIFVAIKWNKIIYGISALRSRTDAQLSPKMDFVCSFKFHKPEIPMKNKKSYNETVIYDSPRSTSTENGSGCSVSSLPSVEYASVFRN